MFRKKIKKPSMIVLFSTMVLLLLASCSFNYEDAAITETLDENIADIVLTNAKLIFVRGTEVVIEAERVEIFSKQKQQNMYKVKFVEVDSKNKVRMEGSTDQIGIETDTNNITMVGAINARSNRDESVISADYLYWNDEKRIMQGSAISPVTIQKDIGSRISGVGFEANAEKRTITINGATEGQLVIEEDDN